MAEGTEKKENTRLFMVDILFQKVSVVSQQLTRKKSNVV